MALCRAIATADSAAAGLHSVPRREQRAVDARARGGRRRTSCQSHLPLVRVHPQDDGLWPAARPGRRAWRRRGRQLLGDASHACCMRLARSQSTEQRACTARWRSGGFVRSAIQCERFTVSRTASTSSMREDVLRVVSADCAMRSHCSHVCAHLLAARTAPQRNSSSLQCLAAACVTCTRSGRSSAQPVFSSAATWLRSLCSRSDPDIAHAAHAGGGGPRGVVAVHEEGDRLGPASGPRRRARCGRRLLVSQPRRRRRRGGPQRSGAMTQCVRLRVCQPSVAAMG